MRLFLFTLLLAYAFTVYPQTNVEQDPKIKQYKKQLNDAINQNNFPSAANYAGKLAFSYWNNQNYTEAEEAFIKSLEYSQKTGNKNGIKTIHYNLGLLYIEMSNYSAALEEFNKGIDIAKDLNQKEEILSGLINKASALENLKNHEKTIQTTEEALKLAKELKNWDMIRRCYGILSENHKALGNTEKSMGYFDKFSTIDKHIKNEQISKLESESQEKVNQIEQAKQLSEEELIQKKQRLKISQDSLRQTIALTKQQEMQLELNQANLEKKEAQLKHERLIREGLIGIIILVVVFLVVFFIQYRQKKKKNKLLEQQYKMINNQKEEIEKQRDVVTQQKKNITDSIEYASRIQNALLPPQESLKQFLPEHFILYKPRDIVSGDFYWMTTKENKLILAAADCTGHGVPGAFMSMLGIAFLNEIVNKITENKHIYALQANEILNQLRNYIISSLHQTTDDSESKDGIDLAMVILDFDNKKLQYAGAHNPLYIIRNQEFIEKKADRMPVAIHKKADKPFTNHEVDFQEGDTLYIFSDGFPDQIGGDKGRKFMSRHFKNLLSEIHEKPMNEQKSILERKFEEWKNGYEQLDDILIIGAKLQTKNVEQKKKDYNWEKHTILIAEDTPMNYMFLNEALKSTNVNIIHAEDGEEAFNRIKENPKIDLVLMDLNMPNVDGFSATKKIKEIRPQLPVIAQTAMNIEDAKEKSLNAGCDDFILKPIQLKSFLKLIDNYLSKIKK
ncbi:MAG: response regulator [Bacteroidales bacterium]